MFNWLISLENTYLVKYRAIGADVCSLVALLLADRCNATRTESGAARSDKLCETANELALWTSRLDVQLLDENVVGLLQVLERIILNV